MDNAKLDSLSLFDKDTYQIGNIKKLVNWSARAGFQGAKMYAGMFLVRRGSMPVRTYAGYVDRGSFNQFCHYSGGAVLFLHGLRGLIKECGYDTPGALFKYLENRK
jgi:hypothetical protein